jgi:hypothetical protein
MWVRAGVWSPAARAGLEEKRLELVDVGVAGAAHWGM